MYNKDMFLWIAVPLLRIVSGVLFFQVGGMKLFDWFGGMPGGGSLPPLILIAGILDFLVVLVLFLVFLRDQLPLFFQEKWRWRISWDIFRKDFGQFKTTESSQCSSVSSSSFLRHTAPVRGVLTTFFQNEKRM